MIVEDFLPEVKANRYTYYNLDKDEIKRFQKLYKFLKRHKNKGVKMLFLYHLKFFDRFHNCQHWTDYLKRYKKMETLTHYIIY
jgi:hypothetical protein